MANRNFTQFTQRAFPANGIANTDFIVGYSGTDEIRVQLKDLLTNATLTSGLNLSIDGPAGSNTIFRNFNSGSNIINFPQWGNNGNTFNNIAVGAYHSISGRGGIAIGLAHRICSPDYFQQYETSLGNIVLGAYNTLSASPRNGSNLMLGVGGIISALDSIGGTLPAAPSRGNIFMWGDTCRFLAVSSTVPYVNQLTNGSQATAFYDPTYGGGPNIIWGSYSELHDSSIGGYLQGGNQSSGNFVMGWGNRVYGGNKNFLAAASQAVLSGMCDSCFIQGGYGNTVVESAGVAIFASDNNYVNTKGNCGQSGKIIIGGTNRIGNVVFTTPAGTSFKNPNSCGGLLLVGENNRVVPGSQVVLGDYNIAPDGYNTIIGLRNKVGLCNFSNGGSDGAIGGFGGQIVLGNDNATGVYNWANPSDGVITNNTPNILLGFNLSCQSTVGSVMFGNVHRISNTTGAIAQGVNFELLGTRRPILLGSNIKVSNSGGSYTDTCVIALDRQNINNGTVTECRRSEQFLLSARGGTFIPGAVGIGIDTMTTATSATLHVNAAGRIIFANLPTSSAGLPTGALWNNSGVLSVA